MSRTDREYLIGLNLIPQLTPKRSKTLFGRYEAFEEIWNAPGAELRSLFGSSVVGEGIAAGRSEEALDAELARADELGVQIVTLVDPEYPHLLREIDDPPLALYARGRMPIDTSRTIAVVGTRRGTRYGKLVAGRLASRLAMKGIIVVSGLAAGIDTAAHQGTLDVGGQTVAVLGCGIDYPYPKRNQPLAAQIASGHGTILSEYPLGMKPAKWTFPQRNRILSGLSRGVIVVQAPERSGSLITARLALEQGREVFSVPGNITSLTSAGTNRLIRQGAKLIETIDDVLAEFPDLQRERDQQPARDEAAAGALAERERVVYELIGLEPVHVDDIIARADLSPTEASHTLLLLQLEGLIEEAEGGRYIRRP